MNSNIKKIIAKEGLIILGLGVPALICFLVAMLLRPQPYAEIFIYISLLLVISYIGLWIYRYVKWAPMRGYYTADHSDLRNIFGAHTKTIIIIAAVMIIILLAIILFPDFAVKTLSFGQR